METRSTELNIGSTLRNSDKRLFFLKTLNGFVQKARDFLTGRVFEVGMNLQGAAIINSLVEDSFRQKISELVIEEMYPDADLLIAVKNSNGFRPALYVCQDAFETLAAHSIRKLLPYSLDFAEEVAGELSALFGRVIVDHLSLLPLLRREVDAIIAKLIAQRLQPTREFIQAFFEVESGFINTKHPDFIAAATDTMAAPSPRQAKSCEPPNRERSQIDLIKRMLTAYFAVVKKNVCDYMPKIVLTLLVEKTLSTCEQELIINLYAPERIEQLLVLSPELQQRAESVQREIEDLRKALKLLQTLSISSRPALNQ